MEWFWLRDWFRMAKFRVGNRSVEYGQHHRRRGSAHSVAGTPAEANVPVRYDDEHEQVSEEELFNEEGSDPGDIAFSEDGDETPYGAGWSDEPDENVYENPWCSWDKCLLMNGDLDQADGLDSDDSSTSGKQVVVAVCAMSKKSQSKPMKEILTRLQEFEYIRMVVIGEEIILNEPVDRWPLCDCLISFHSKGFPLEKAIQYAQLRQPYVINNLHMQFDIQDRRRVYAILENEGIEIPRYAVLDRDSPDPKQHELVESEDHVEVNGIIFNKPFVEKPVSAEDHNIYIYYPTSAGGGSQRLFRKIASRSSVYSPESRVRKTGSFIYEDFMPTDGTDVKVYTVGPDYAHAEARKSPALDGKVERDRDGKEIRYPVILSNAEKLISRKVCLAFKQTVCGFDLLRANGKSFVCDVNGFSFVKNSNKYYDDCAKILGNMILRELAPQLHIPWSVPFQLDDPPIVPTTFGKMMELRCVTAVIRHGDRTPKQKMKVEVRHQKFFEIFEKYDGYRYGHIKLKRPKQLQEILDIARSLLAEIQTKAADSEIEEKQSKLEQLKSVLEMYGHFSGINRKVQMKYQPKGRPRGSSSDDGKNGCSTFVFVPDAPKEPSLVLILKWGGELTPAGRIQAEEMGRIFRCMYPGGQSRQPGAGEGPGTQGLGLLRLHSTYRHDLKIYASDEGRVQMTAAAFAKGLLALEGELTPILVQMVKSANTNGLLDNDCDSSKYQNMAKSRLHELMQIDREFTAEDVAAINPGNAISINLAMKFVKNPVQCCAQVHSLIRSLMAVVAVKRDDPKTREAVLYHGETWELMGRRWGKIEKDFCTKSKSYDISKIPDIYDCIKYDLQHNQHTLQFDLAEELYISAKYLADIVIPQEYGLTMHEKLTIGQGICTPLLKKIRADLQRNIEELGGEESVNRLNPRYSHGVSSPGRHVRTRLYFTSESHVHSLLTVLRHGGLLNVLCDEQWRRAMEYVSMVSELNYMSQIVIMLYEDPMKDPSSEERFHVELHFSPGVNCCVQKNLPPGPGFRPHSRNDSVTSKNASGDEDTTSRIDEENDTEEDSSFSNNSSLHHTPSKTLSKTDTDIEHTTANTCPTMVKERRIKKMKSSSPIPIGSCHTVSGHEAMDLAKRLSEELAVQQQQQQQHLHLTGSFCGTSKDITRQLSPEAEPRARSFEHQQQHSHQHHHHHGKGHHHRSKGKGALAGGQTAEYARCCMIPAVVEMGERMQRLGYHTPDENCDICKTIPVVATPLASVDVAFSSLSSILQPDESDLAPSCQQLLYSSKTTSHSADLDCGEKHVSQPVVLKTEPDLVCDASPKEEDKQQQVIRRTLYIGPPESSYSTDSISEFTPNLEEQELYVSSFSESEDDNDAGDDAFDDASESEHSRYYSALGQHECGQDNAPEHQHHLRRSLSYTFTNDPERYHSNGEVVGGSWSNRRVLPAAFAGIRAIPQMTRSVDELDLGRRRWEDANSGHTNCCCSYCWMARVSRFSLKTPDPVEPDASAVRRSRSLTPPLAGGGRLRSYTTSGITQAPGRMLQVPGNGASLRYDPGDLRRSRLVRYPIRTLARFASDPSLPLGPAWAGNPLTTGKLKEFRSPHSSVSPPDNTARMVFLSLTTPPPDEDDSAPLLVQLQELKISNEPVDSTTHSRADDYDDDDERCHLTADDNPSRTYFDEPDGSSPPSGMPLALPPSFDTLTLSQQPLMVLPSSTLPSAIVPLSNRAVPCGLTSTNYITSMAPYTSVCLTSTPTTTATITTSTTFTTISTRSTISTVTITNATVTTTTSFLATVASSSSVTTTDTTVCFAVVVPCVTPVADTSNIFSTCSSYIHTTNASTLGLTLPSLLPGVSERKKPRCPAKPFVKSYTTDGGSGGYSTMLLTTTATTTTTAVSGQDGATPAIAAATVVTSEVATMAGTGGMASASCCLYCCSSGSLGGTRPAAMAAGATTPSYCCCCCCCPTPSSSGGAFVGTGAGGPAGSVTASATTVRRQRHSIAGQMSYFKMLGTFSKKMATSTNSLFSTAVISGSSSAPNLRDMIPSTASPSGFGGVPPIRPLETLHNALSLKQLDTFLERMTVAPLFKTPASSPPPKHPLVSSASSKGGILPVQEHVTHQSSSLAMGAGFGTTEDRCPRGGVRDFTPLVPAGPSSGVTGVAANGSGIAGTQQSWSDHSSSMTSSISALSSGGPSSPNYSEVYSRGCPSSDMSASITSTDGSLAAVACGVGEQLVALPQHFFGLAPAVTGTRTSPRIPLVGDAEDAETEAQEEQELVGRDGAPEIDLEACLRRSSTLDISGDLTPVSVCSDWDANTNDATKGSTATQDLTTANTTEEDDEDATISTDTCLSVSEPPGPVQSRASLETDAGCSGLSSGPITRGPVVWGAFTPSDAGISKQDNRVRGSRIQRQISLYEKDSRTESRNLQPEHEWWPEGTKFEAGSRPVAAARGPAVLSRLHMSFDELRKELPHGDRNLLPQEPVSRGNRQVDEPDKSFLLSLAQLAVTQPPLTAPHAPGALVIREGFIEPPRLTRVTKSFHGKTDHQKVGPGGEGGAWRRASEGPPEGAAPSRYNKNLVRQQSSSGSSQGRFTTSIVQEPLSADSSTPNRLATRQTNPDETK
ncbi:uncharacterized protein LOC128728972 [Anopheles nili]|uniref:uncharacterized protein LOC128728972 n=1 Tax=Anopheles nili TaxID=185578 RepID=UPI00237AE5E2|nr:uncharacterized protein LOC128728972 [Anopheles nili]